MAFVNKEITTEDRIKYQLDDAESSQPKGVLIPSRYWALDAERAAYLRQVWRAARGPESHPNLNSLGYKYHFFANDITYFLSITKDKSKQLLAKSDDQRYLCDYLTLTNISPLNEYSKSSDFMSLLCEALKASEGGDSFIAMLAIENGSLTKYELNFNVALGE